jgi:hypothetical protein
VIPGIYAAAVAECNSCALHVPQIISVLCVFMLLQTVIKELNLKFKTIVLSSSDFNFS